MYDIRNLFNKYSKDLDEVCDKDRDFSPLVSTFVLKVADQNKIIPFSKIYSLCLRKNVQKQVRDIKWEKSFSFEREIVRSQIRN